MAKRVRTKVKSGRAKSRAATTRKSKPRPAKAAARRPAKRARARAKGDDMRALARRIVDVTLANDDEAAFALYASDVESVEPGQPPMRGVDAIRQKFSGWRSMVSGARFEPRRICVDGDTIVIEWMGDVTLAANAKQVRLHEVAIHQIRDGKISRELFFYDPSTFA